MYINNYAGESYSKVLRDHKSTLHVSSTTEKPCQCRSVHAIIIISEPSSSIPLQ